MRNEPQYKTVAITYADDKPLEFILLVTDISYHDSYIKVEYRETIHKDGVKIIAMRDIKNIAITELDEFEANKTLMYLAEKTAGTDFTQIRFNPWNGDRSIVTVTSFRNIDHKDFTFEKVTKIERKWDHDIMGHRILIHTIHKNAGLVWSGIEAIYVFDESDVKSLIIGRTGMKDIKVNVNGGKYDND